MIYKVIAAEHQHIIFNIQWLMTVGHSAKGENLIKSLSCKIILMTKHQRGLIPFQLSVD